MIDWIGSFREPTPIFEINDPKSPLPALAAALDAPAELTDHGQTVVVMQINGEFAEITLDTAEEFSYAVLSAVYNARAKEGSDN